VRLRPAQGRGPGDRIESPYDSEARFRTKAGTSWTGYMVHLTETCDAGAPRLVVHADTTPANVHEAMRTGPIHDALAAKGLAPSEHLVDSAYVSAEHLVGARERHGIDLFGPARPDQSWQKQVEGAFQATDFVVDWERRRVRCPEGHESTTWGQTRDKASGRSLIRVGFSPAQCQPCPSRSRCTQGISRWLGLRPRPEHEALAAARARLESEAGRQLYAQRQGVESTLSQGVRAFGLRQARYRGLAKTGLQNVATAAALNLDRLIRFPAD
jgi:IS5 family transposase